MSIVDRDYSFSIDDFNKPKVYTNKEATSTRLMQLIMMEPGDDPLHPEMGVGIKSYRYSIEDVSVLEERIKDQIDTYLPFYQNVSVKGVVQPNKVVNLEITMDDVVYVYESDQSPKPILLNNI